MEADDIDPQAATEVRRLERFPIPHSRLGLKLARRLSGVLLWFQNRGNPAVGATTDLTIPGPDGDLDARLYVPEGDGPFPTIVFFHGGGFVLGSIGTHDWLCRHLTRESDCAVLSVDYRLAPEHPYPAAVEDADAAVRWTATNPDAVRGNGRLAVAGDSAGGTLAAVAARRAAERGDPTVDYQALLYPAIGIEPDQDSVRDHAGTVLSQADLEFFQTCYLGEEPPTDDPDADPIAADDLGGLPPATIVTAGFDPLRDGGTRYAERLESAGVPVTHQHYDAMVHGFATMRDVDRARDAIALISSDVADGVGRG